MAGAVMPSITLEDLTRDELLKLVSLAAPVLRQRDPWRARWEAASERYDALSRKSEEAAEQCAAAADAYATAREGSRLSRQAWKSFVKAREERATLGRAADRAWKASERAYAALSASMEA